MHARFTVLVYIQEAEEEERRKKKKSSYGYEEQGCCGCAW
jgi:hypothetical protein